MNCEISEFENKIFFSQRILFYLKLNDTLIILFEDQKMKENKYFKDRRVGDPYVDRRSGEDRRQAFDFDYWESGGIERRSAKDQRQQKERRACWVKVSKWSSVCPEDNAKCLN